MCYTTRLFALFAAGSAACLWTPEVRSQAVEDAIAACRQSYRDVANCRMTATRETSVRCPIFPEWQPIESATMQLTRDGGRARLLDEITGTTYHNGEFAPFTASAELVWDQGQIIDISRSHYGKTGETLEALGRSPGEVGVSGTFDMPQSADLESFPKELSRIAGVGLVFGTLQSVGETWLPDLIAGIGAPQVTTHSESLHVTISGDTPHGFLTVVLDPAAGHLPVSLQIEHGSQHYLGNQRVSEYPELNYGSYWPSGRLEKYIDQYSDIQFGYVSDMPYIKSLIQERTYVLQNETELSMLDRYDVTSMECPEEFADAWFVPVTPVPDGTSVYLEEAPHMAYEMQQGRMTASFDKGAVDAFLADELTLSRGRMTLLMINGGVLLFLATGVVVFRRRSAKP